jgi:hypothetical protein
MTDKDKLRDVGSLSEPSPAGERIVNTGISINRHQPSEGWVQDAVSEMGKFVEEHILPIERDTSA